MASRLYEYKLDQQTIWWTAIHIVAIIFGGIAIFGLYLGGLFSAWFCLFVLAFVLLMVLSIPRTISLTDRRLTINSVLDVTSIEIKDIVSAKKVSPRKIRWIFPIFASCGFFGHYGYFFDFRSRRVLAIYITHWRYLIEIVDKDDNYYYISSHQRDELIEELSIKALAVTA
ncbi:MAG: PH domain-containing protein [Rikenellaceae bacterium]